MKCPNCGGVFDDGCRFCGACGAPLEYEKTGSHRVPLLILLALSVLGIVIYFATGGDSAPSPGSSEEAAVFAISEGELHFDPGAYPGGSELEIPETVDGETVTRISAWCFSDCDSLTSVKLPDTVEFIGVSAFEDCDGLVAMDLPDSVTTIGTDAFWSCDSLEAVHIPAGVNYIGWDAFSGCDRLAYIFYDGTFDQWQALCGQEISSDPQICCADGNDWKAK